jgi:putative tryptophan/tyrosine transport system substrate-binding protein
LRRRDFVTLIGGGSAAWPIVARAQQPAMPVIGFLSLVATKTIPIVFTYGADPVKAGIVTSLNRPEENITGVAWFGDVAGKRVDLVRRGSPYIAIDVRFRG